MKKRDEDHEDDANADSRARWEAERERKCRRLDREDGVGPCNESEEE